MKIELAESGTSLDPIGWNIVIFPSVNRRRAIICTILSRGVRSLFFQKQLTGLAFDD